MNGTKVIKIDNLHKSESANECKNTIKNPETLSGMPLGGTVSAEGQYTPYLAYTYSHGKMFNNLLGNVFVCM